MTDDKKVSCSFCGKKLDDIWRLVEGPDNIYICNECVAMCVMIMIGNEEGLKRIYDVNNRQKPEDAHDT